MRSSPETLLVRASESCDGRPPNWRRAHGEPAGVPVLDAHRGRAGRRAAQAQAPALAGSAGVYWVYVGTYTNGQGRDRSRGIYLMELDVRSGRLDAPRLAAASSGPVVPGDPSQPRVPLRGQRVGRGQGPARRGRQRLRDRPEQGDAGAAEPAVIGRLGPVPPGRRPPGTERAGGQLRQRQRGLPADRVRRPAPPGLGEDPAPAARAPIRGGRPARTRTRSTSTRRTDTPSWPTSGSTRSSIYAFDPAQGQLTPHQPPFAKVAPGSGPRHFAFHPEGRFGYVINEMANTVTAFAYDADAGILTEMQTISTLPADFRGQEPHRRGPGPPLRQVPLRVEPRARQHRDLRHRPDAPAS